MANSLRPLSIGELLDRSFSIYRKQFVVFVTIATIPAALVFAAQLGFARLATTNFNGGGTPGRFSLSLIGPAVAIGAFIFSIVFLLVTALAQGALVKAASAVVLDQPTSIAEALAAMKGNVARTAGVIFVTGLLAGLGLLLLVVPGILLWLRWGLVIPATVLEEAGVSESRSRSSLLTEGCRGRILLIFFLYFVVLYTLLMVVQIPIMALLTLTMIKAGGSPPVMPFWFFAANYGTGFVVSALVTPILTIALTLQYYDGRVRKEALDLQLLMNSAFSGATAGGAGA